MTDFYKEQNEKAKQHSLYRHFTTLEALAHIFESRSFRLSQLNKLNDPTEEQRISPLVKKKVFVLCFNHSEQETIPMWKIYASDKLGLCLEFNDLSFLEDKKNYSEISDGWELRHTNLLDILYDSDTDKYKQPPDNYPICIGFLKDNIWDFEQETRARCYVAPNDLSKIRIEDDTKYLLYYPDFEYIYCRISDSIINSIRIVFNPFMDDIQKKIVKAVVKQFVPDFNDNNFFNSSLEGRISNR